MKRKTIILTIMIICFAIIGLVSMWSLTKHDNNKLIAKNTEQPIEIVDAENKNIEESEVVLTVGSNYEVYKMSKEDILNNKNYYAVIGKITSIDGTTNYNEVTKEYTTVFSLGKMQIIKDLKGNMKSDSIDIMKRGGKISLEQYEKSLSESQKQKTEFQALSKTYASKKANVQVEFKSLDEVNIEMNKEYLFILMYNKDYDRYLINAFPYAIKEVKMEDSKMYFKDNSTNTFEEFADFGETLSK